jgi:ABC-type transport system substrate-binding protein
MNNMRRTLSLHSLCIVAMAALALGGCGKKNGAGPAGDTKDAGSPVGGDWVVIHEISDPETLNLVTAQDASAQEIHSYIYEALTVTNPKTLEREPWIADSLPRVSDDHLTYDFTLRKNAVFSDGKPVTGADFIFYLKAIKNPAIINAAATRGYYEKVVSAELVDNDPYKLRFHMSEPYFLGADVIGDLTALPKHIWDPKNLSDKITFEELNKGSTSNPAIAEQADFFQDVQKGFAKEFLVGSGPYMFEQFNRNDRVVLVKNPKYWNSDNPLGKAYPDKLLWRTITDPTAAVTSLQGGELDVMPRIEKVQYRNVEPRFQSLGLKAAEYDYPTYTYLGYNEDRPIFKSKAVRNALARAIDRKAIIEKIYFGMARPVQSPIFYKRPEADTTLPVIAYDLELAKKMLADDGWADTDGDGILDKMLDGKKTNLSFKILLNSGNQARKQIALIFVDALKKIGVDANTTELEWATFSERTRKGDFDAMIGGWAMGVTEGDLYQIWHSNSAAAGGSNHVKFRNPEVDKLIETIRTEFDPAKRRELSKQMQRIIHDEQPYNFLVSERFTGGYSGRFQNVEFFAPRPCYNAGWWWVPLTAQKYKTPKTVASAG